MDRGEYTTLAALLSEIPDPRRKKGIRHQWGLILTLIGAGMLCQQQHMRAIGQWVREHRELLVEFLAPQGGRLPSEATLRRALLGLDMEQLQAKLGRFGRVGHTDKSNELRGQSLDGKQVRGAGAHGHKVHLLGLARHDNSAVLAQAQVSTKTNEIGAAPGLLKGQELRGTLTTMDAMLSQRQIAQQIRAQGGHYLMVIKENQPETYGAIEELFREAPWLPSERDSHYWKVSSSGKAHGRYETRVLEASDSLNEWLRWPGVKQVMRRTCRRVLLGTGEVEEEIGYAVTSLRHEEASAQTLQSYWRGHWSIENRLHYVRDVTMGEDKCRAHTGQLPQAMAALRNSILALLRHHGHTNIARALRHYDAHPTLALTLIGASPSQL